MADSPLFAAAKAGDAVALRQRLDMGDDINARENDEHPLTWAAFHGHASVVQVLIERGANLHVTDCGGRTALELARRNHRTGVETMLMAAVQQAAEGWVRMGASTIAEVGSYPALGRKLTHIFNFKTRERLTISENLATRAEAVTPPTGFDDLPRAALEEAFAEFTRLGGKADRDAVFDGGSSLGKPSRPPKLETPHG